MGGWLTLPGVLEEADGGEAVELLLDGAFVVQGVLQRAVGAGNHLHRLYHAPLCFVWWVGGWVGGFEMGGWVGGWITTYLM